MFNFSQSKLAELVSEAMVVILHCTTVDFFYVIISYEIISSQKEEVDLEAVLLEQQLLSEGRDNSTVAGTEIKYSRFPTNVWKHSEIISHTITQWVLC